MQGYADHVDTCYFDDHHISRWWNQGLHYIAQRADDKHEVLAVSSDYVGNEHSVRMLANFLRDRQLTMVGPNHWSNEERIFKLNDPRGTTTRVPGDCWMLAGESGLRIDENFRWWYSDDDLEMQARQYSGTGILPNTGLHPELDSPLSEEKHKWAIEDRAKFIAKWGKEPW